MTILKLGESLKKIISTINENISEIWNKLTYSPVSVKVLYTGSAVIPSRANGLSVDITLNDDLSNFDGLIFQREDTNDCFCSTAPTIGTIYKVVNTQADYTMMFDGMNLFMCNAEVIENNKIKLSGNVYSGLKTNAGGRYINNFDDCPLVKIIGFKMN